MSVAVSTYVWKLKLPPAEKLVMLALADWANDDGVAYPGRAKLATKTSLGESTIPQAVRRLESKGLLKVEQSASERGTNVYRIIKQEGYGDHIGSDASYMGKKPRGGMAPIPNTSVNTASPNGDGGKATDGRSDTIVGKAVEALGFAPVERGAFAKIVTEAAKTVDEAIILKAVRHWGDGAEPVSWLTGHIGQLDREHRARGKRASNGASSAAARHDGKHDPACWCYQVPDEQRAKVHRGDLLRAAGLKPESEPEAPASEGSGVTPE